MKKRSRILLWICFWVGLLPAFADRLVVSINDGWLFSKSDDTHYALESIDRKNWEVIALPHTWNAQDSFDEEPGYYRSGCWYRKTMTFSDQWKGKKLFIHFEGANQITTLFVNGKIVGSHKGGYAEFVFDVTPYVKWGEENLLAVRVDNSHQKDIPPLSADFTFFGGIYRDVYLKVVEPTHISLSDYASNGVYIRTLDASQTSAKIEIETLLTHPSDGAAKNLYLVQRLVDPQGYEIKKIQQKVKFKANTDKSSSVFRIEIANPLLWSIESPNLYKVITQLYDSSLGKVIDQVIHPLGIRWFSFDPETGFFLNGKSVKLIGTNRHQCFWQKGNAVTDDYHIRDILLLKEMGGNFLRISHYPQDPTILQMCDKLGIIASVEIPIVNEITSSQEFETNCVVMIKEMIRQNFNHPSVVIWAYMNEVLLKPPYKKEDPNFLIYAKEVNRLAHLIEALIRQEDTSRYTMIPCHGALDLYKSTGLTSIPMILGWNLYQGWYGGPFGGFDEFVDAAHKEFPTQPMIITEYGADSDPRLHSFHPQRFDFSIEYATLYHVHYLSKIMKSPFIAGAAIWNLNDFYSEQRGDAVPHVNNKGITAVNREVKDSYLFYKAVLSSTPLVCIGGQGWERRVGLVNEKGVCSQPIDIFSNKEKVEVIHNGHSLGEFPLSFYYTQVMVPFVAGNNLLEVRRGEATDYKKIFFQPIEDNLSQRKLPDFNLHVMMGSKRYFEDKETGVIWMPEKEYTPGSWGFVGGSPYSVKTRHGMLPAAEIDVLGTNNDPVYQTQRVGLSFFKADVPKGLYAIYFHWCELESGMVKEALVYNLGNEQITDQITERVFDVFINEEKVFDRLNIAKEVGAERAVVKKVVVAVDNDGQGLSIRLAPHSNSTILNAIQIMKLY